MKLKYDKLLSKFAFNCKVRHYAQAYQMLRRTPSADSAYHNTAFQLIQKDGSQHGSSQARLLPGTVYLRTARFLSTARLLPGTVYLCIARFLST